MWQGELHWQDLLPLAPDALTPLGGYPGNDDQGREMQSKRDRNEMLEDFIAGYEYLKRHIKIAMEKWVWLVFVLVDGSPI